MAGRTKSTRINTQKRRTSRTAMSSSTSRSWSQVRHLLSVAAPSATTTQWTLVVKLIPLSRLKHLLQIQIKRRHLLRICAPQTNWVRVAALSLTSSSRISRFNFNLVAARSVVYTLQSCPPTGRGTLSRQFAKTCYLSTIRSNRRCWSGISFSRPTTRSFVAWTTSSSLRLGCTSSCPSSTVVSCIRFSILIFEIKLGRW